MKLHLPKSLRTALLTCLAALAPWSLTVASGVLTTGAAVCVIVGSSSEVAVAASTVLDSSVTTTVGDVTYAGYVLTLDVPASNANFHSQNMTYDDGSGTVVNIGTSAGGPLNQAGWYYFANGSISSQYGNTLHLTGIEGNVTLTTTFSAFSIGGLIVDAQENTDYTYTLGRHGSSGYTVNFEAAEGVDVNADINSDVAFDANAGYVVFKNDGAWDIATGVSLTIDSLEVALKATVSELIFQGGGEIDLRTSALSIADGAKLSVAEGTTLRLGANTTVSTGNGTLANAGNLYMTNHKGSFALENTGDVYLTGSNTFGSLSNSGVIHFNEGSNLYITSQAAYQGAVLTLGNITGLSGNTFSYGNGWLATYDAATGTATITDNSSIYWIDNGEDGNTLWSAAENWQGGVLPTASDTVRLGSDGAGRIVSFDGDATVGEVRVVAGDYGFVVSGNSTLTGSVYVAPVGATLTKSGAGTLTLTNVTANALSVTEGELVVNTLSLAHGSSFTKNGAGTLTLTNVTANALSVTEGELVVNTLSLAHGSSFTKNGVGTMKLGNVSGILGKDVTVEAGELHITQTGDNDVATNTVYTVTVESGATLNDDRRLRLTGGSLTVTGGGIYELEGICLSGTATNATSLNVGADTTLHITGTTQHADGDKGSFMLSNWNAGNTINIEGLLVSDAGISNRDGTGVINIENGGALQLNAGMSRTTHSGKKTTINVKSGASLIVNGTNTGGTQHITTNLSDGSTVFTTSGATIANNMTYNGTVKLGAAADAELSLTAASPSFSNLTIMGSADKVSALDARTVKEYAAGGTVKFTNALSGTSITLNAGAQFEATAGLTLTGALTLGANAEATLGGAVSIASLAGKNAGTLTFADSLTSLALQDFNIGQEYEIGTVTNGNNVDWCALLNYSNTLHTITYENGVLISSYKEVLWSSPADNDITWGGADNWSVGGSSIALSGTENVVLGVIDTTVEQPVSSVIQIAANTTVAGVTVRDAYSLSVAEGAEFSFDSTTVTFEEGGSLSKVGQGTLSMNVADATAAKMNIAEGTLKIDETLMQVKHGSDTRVDLTALSSSTSGVLSIAASGNQSAPGKGTGTDVSHITLSDAFTGIVEVRSGKLHVLAENGGDSKGSDLGGATGLRLDGGGILITSSGSGFAGQSLSLNLEVGASGGYIDLFGGSTNVMDNWSSKHTGALTGSGVLTFIGMGEWVLAGDYSAFTGGLALGSESQYLYISSDMENLKSLDWNNAYQHDTNKASVVVGYGNTAGVKMTVADKQTVSYNGSAIKLTNGSTFTHTGGVTVADNTTFNVTSYDANSSGIYNTANVEFATANSKLAVAGKVVANITGSAAYTATCGTIDIASGATVNDNRALTIDGAYNITGAGTYNQLGTLALTENGVLTLSGKVSINSLAGNNAGVLTFAELSSLELKDFVIGEAYEIGTVTDGANVDWQSLMGYTDRRYSIEYDNGMLNSVFNDIVWSSAADDDITWGGSDNWVMGGESVAVEATDSVLLGTIGDSGVSSTIQLAANTTVAGVTVQDAYSLSVAEGETYSFDAGTIVLDGGSLSKTGAGTLSMSLEDAVTAQMNIAQGTLSISGTLADTSPSEVSPIDMSALGGVGTLSITAAGVNGGISDGTRTNVVLGDGFTGTLQVSGGQLDADSTTGGASLVVLDGATLTDTHGDGVHTVAWNIKVSDNDAYLRHFGNAGSDERTSYATRLTGALTGSADAMLKVIDAGEWFLAGDMSGYQGGMSIEGNTNYVTFERNATLASLTAVNGSHILVDNNATLTAPALAVSGTIYTGATEGATFNMGAVTIADNGTLDVSGTGSHVIDSLDMTAATTNLTLGEHANLTVGTWVAEQNGDTETVSISLGAGAELAYTSTDKRRHINQTVSVTLGAESTIKDAGVMQMSGGKLTVSGNGVYELAGLQLSGAGQGIKTALEVGAGATLHITGTTNNDKDEAGAFFTHNWGVAQESPNTISVSGVLALECGISSAEGYGVITVNSGGKLAFNRGLTADSRHGNRDTININDGGVLEVSGTNVTGTNLVTVNVAANGIVMGGNANGAAESKIANNLNFTGTGAYFGAKEGTSLTIAPEDGLTSMNWLVVLGDGTEVSTDNAGGMVAFDNALTVNNNVYIRKGGGLGVLGNITTPKITNMGALVFDGAGTITLNQAILNAGTVEILNAADTQFVLNNAMLSEVAGVSKTWTLVNNTGVKDLTGTITGWDALGLENFLLDGSTLQLGDWDAVSIADGKVMLYMLSRYWDATGAESVWNTGVDANWREFADATETVTFETNSRVTFTDTDETDAPLDKSVTVADAGVQAKNVTITGTDYVFSGGKVAVTDSLNIQESAEFDSTLVIGSTSTPLSVVVSEGKTLTVGTLETSSSVSYGNTIYNNGAFLKTGEGTLLITDAINGTITGATVSGGKLVLGVAGTDEIAEQSVALMVGANTISSAGGSLENVVLQTSGTVTDYTGAEAQALNVIKSADGVNYAALTDVQLSVGAASSYATLQKVAFAGTSALSGYITFEETKQQRQMAVATDGTLTVSNLTFDLHGLSAGTKVLIENDAVEGAADGFKGTLLGWDAQNVKLLYSGIAVNNAAVDMGTAGVVTLNTDDTNTDANMYWDGLVAGAAEGDAPVASSAWDKSSANWSASAGTDGDSAFLALSNTYFGATPEGGSKVVNAALDMVMSNMFVTEGGYSFTGSRLATLGNMHITPASGAVIFANDLVAQGNVTLSAAKGGSLSFAGMLQVGGTITANVEGALSFDNAVSAGGKVELNAQNLAVNGALRSAGDVSISSGATTAGGAGSLTIGESGSITGANVTINVNAGAESDTHYRDYVVESAGNITATAEGGKVSFTGNGAAHITGTVTADEIVVDTQSSNGIIFRQLDTDTLTITEGSYAALTNETPNGQRETSRIGTIQLGGRLGLTQFAGTYSGYNLVTTSDSASVDFAAIAMVTLDSVKGELLADGTYGSIVFNDSYRTLTINKLETVNNITFGAGEYWAKLENATGGIHGNFTAIGGKVVNISSDNIMAETNTTGHWELGTTIDLKGTVQTLRGNTVNMTGAVITGDAAATGLSFADSSTINYGGSNTISANMTVADGKTLTLKAGYAASQSQSTVDLSSDDTLLLSGALSGTGALNLTGDGVVTINKANSAYTGTVTVGGGSSLELTHVDALSKAAISLAGDGTLVLNAGAPVNVAGLTIADGASLSLIGLAPTDAADLTAAGLINADTNGINWTKNNGSLTLNILLDQEVENMMTYNLFTDKQALATSGVTLKVFHNGQELDASQYNVGYDADKKLVYIRTMIGNIWNGGSKLDGETYTADGIWGLTNEDANWSGKNYTDSKAAIFVDAPTEESANNYVVVTLVDDVTPGDVYFEADSTSYQLNSAANDDTAGLAAGTDIHKAGSADVNLSLANNGTMENAIGNIDLQKGHIYLGENLAVSGEVVIAKDAHLRAFEAALVTDNYTAKGDYSNLLMQSDRIAGTDNSLGEVNDGVISGAAELEYLNMAGTGKLTDVAIGSDVNVVTDAAYTLAGAVTFNETLVNSGTVTLDAGMTAEIGQLGYSFTVDDKGASWYTYQLVQGGTINGMSDLLVGDVTIGGVSLGTGLADGVATYITNVNGSITLSIGNVTGSDGQGNVTSVDGSIGVPQWDERWSDASKQPSLSRRYAGTTADTNVSFAEGITDDADYYWYSSVVNEENANKVNGTGDEVVVTLSSASTGARAAGGSSAGSADLEMWVYDRSGFTTVVAGQFAEAATDAYTQNADTHVLVNSVYGKTETTDAVEKTWVVGGSWNVAQNANSYVTVQDGKILTLVGGSKDANQVGTSYVYIDGGRLFEVIGSSFASDGSDVMTHKAAEGETLASRLVITGGTLGGAASDGGTKSVYGGGYRIDITGDIWVTVDGKATITNLVGGNYGGSIKGSITMDLVSGTVNTVNAAGAGNSSVTGDVLVNLTQGFKVTGGLYGGNQSGSGVTLNGSSTSTLAFVSEGETYDLSAIAVQGFDSLTLADGTQVKVSTQSGFATDSASGVLTISGHGKVELVGDTDLARDITLEDGATLWFNSDSAGNAIGTTGSRRTLTATAAGTTTTAGTTIDITGQPVQGDGLCVWLDLAGHGVDNKGALYKGLSGAATDPSGKVALPRITLSDSASINAEDNIYVIEFKNEVSELFLQGNTLTKVGANALTFFNTTVDTGNIYVKEGTLGVGYSMRAQSANVIVGGGSTLNIISIGSDTGTAKIGSLSGSGATNLGYILQVTTNDTGNYIPGSDYMTQGADAYGQFSADTGFAYGVYSGKIRGASSLYVSGDGTQYLSGSESDYSGGTHLTDSATLYLLGGTEGTATKGASTVTSGVLGTGALAWDSANTTLYLGNGVRVYNNGVCNADGSSIIIGVEGAPVGAKLAEGTTYLGVHSRGENGSITYITLDNKEYVEVATHNLQSISCDGMYADGTAYVAGTEIDRNKMLLVSKEVWAANEATVTGFSGNGYNEAIYSGVLSGNVSFEKVGIGTLVLDQANEYTGSTTISEGSLVLKGWAQIGSAADGASINVEQQEGTSLVLAYDGSYGDEITGIANNITLTGEGDARWKTDAEHMATSALISDVGADVAFTLSGDISGEGGILHSGAGTLVLSGDSSFTGGTHATNGVVEVQSATGLGAGVVTVDSASDLHVTVEDGTTASRLTTTIKAPGSSVKGDVVISGTESTERILNVATGGYDNSSTMLHDNGTLLVNGSAVSAQTAQLKGSGTVAVSDATGNGASANVGLMTDYTGDLHVEGNNASIVVENGIYSGGSISVSGSGANVSTNGDVTIVSGESLSLTSKGNAGTTDTSAAVRTTGAVNVTNGATLSVAAAETSYEYNLQNLQASASLNGVSDLESGAENQAYTAMGTSAEEVYKGFFNTSLAMNQKAAGSVDADGGLTLSGGASYETSMANTSLMGGTLTLDTTTTSLLNFDTTLDAGAAAIDGSGRTTQLVLFSDVGGVNFVLDDMEAVAGSGIYYTRADRYIGGCGYVDEETWLVYDSGAGVVYLDGLIPEPTTATLSLLALAALAARRRRK
ncbi:MAG: autotransporter-associated beta strand repeat-containing protein [Akkermansia sp.]|nr:autotransporter-associated beta strand repeat-containing protein [Akkermansia sp.]